MLNIFPHQALEVISFITRRAHSVTEYYNQLIESNHTQYVNDTASYHPVSISNMCC